MTGDRYAGEFPRELFRKRAIEYVCSEKPKSDLFRDFLPLLNSGSVVLPKSDRLVAQLCNLERRTARSGRDSIDHGPGGYDDLANACAGAAVALANKTSRYRGSAEEMKQWVGTGELEIWPYGQRPLSMHPFLFWK